MLELGPTPKCWEQSESGMLGIVELGQVGEMTKSSGVTRESGWLRQGEGQAPHGGVGIKELKAN